MAQNPIQWFPGHMAKTVRMMKDCLGDVDIIIELLDARIPYSSKNPETEKILAGKPKLIILTKASLANETVSRRWLEYYKNLSTRAVLIDSVSGYGIKELENAVRDMLAEKIAKYAEKGMSGRRLKARKG